MVHIMVKTEENSDYSFLNKSFNRQADAIKYIKDRENDSKSEAVGGYLIVSAPKVIETRVTKRVTTHARPISTKP